MADESLCLQGGLLKRCLKSTSMEIGTLTSGQSLIQCSSDALPAVYCTLRLFSPVVLFVLSLSVLC